MVVKEDDNYLTLELIEEILRWNANTIQKIVKPVITQMIRITVESLEKLIIIRNY